MALMFLTRKRNRRSNINLSHVSATTLAPGNLAPVSMVRVFSGDSLRFRPSSFVQAFPMKAPLVNGFKLCLEYFFVPDRLYNSDLLLDVSGVTDRPETVKFPCVQAPAFTGDTGSGETVVSRFELNFKNYSKWSKPGDCPIVTPGSFADYMGFPVGMYPTFTAADGRNKFNALPVLGYLDIVAKYYANQQYPKVPTALWTPLGADSASNPSYDLDYIQDVVNRFKKSSDPDVTLSSILEDYSYRNRYTIMSWDWLCSRASIFQRCLPPYYLESWLATSGYEESEVKVDLEADGNSISFRNLSAQSHVQRWLDLALAGGSRYSDYLNSEFDVSRVRHTSSPIFLGSDRQFLGSNVIYQTTGFEDANSPLGAFAGQASGGDKFRQRSYKFGETGYFMVIASLVPDVIYLRGLNPFLREQTLADVYAPALDNIAMQPLMVEELNAVSPVADVSRGSTAGGYVFQVEGDSYRKNEAVGFVPAWSQLMQVVSRAHGRLTTELKYWLLTREYGDPITQNVDLIRADIKSALNSGELSYPDAEALVAFLESSIYSPSQTFSPYVRSNAYNDVFADTSDNAQNFVVTFTASMSVNREKAKVNVPNTI